MEARRARFEQLATSADHLLLVAEVDDRVIGYGLVAHHPGSYGCQSGWYLAGLVVSPEFRRHGTGERLTIERLHWISARSDEAFYVANEQNLVTIDLHARLGFEEVTREFAFPGIEFQDGRGILFRADLSRWDR